MDSRDVCAIKGKNQRELMLSAGDFVEPQITHIKIRALLVSGCGQDLINSILVLRMGLATKCLKETLTFEQMDRSPMGGSVCDLKTETVPMWMGEHMAGERTVQTAYVEE